jgi:hypothetical protein
MFGYQGWHATPNDGAGNNVWRHWFGRNSPDSAVANFDVWPDMREYPKDVLEETNMTMPNGAKASLYSAYKYGTVDLHFKWLKEHNLDGVFQQRFISDIRSGGGKKHFNQVVRNVQKASEKYKRVYCIMYDITGAGPNWKQTLMADWKFLVDSFNVTKGSSYLHHDGRPLLAIWGMGFTHNAFATVAQSDSLMDWFNKDAEEKYQATIMGGINDNWLTHSNEWKAVYDKMDMQLPDVGLMQMQDAETGANKWVDTSSAMVRYNYQQHFFQQTDICKRHFMKAGAELLHIRTDEDYVKILQQFFLRRT